MVITVNKYSSFNYINNSDINQKDQHKDLGIILTNNLNWIPHYNSIISQAYMILGLIRRTFTSNYTMAKKQTYNIISLVCSKLMHCSQIWRPHLIKDITALERVQCRATKYILNDYHSDYKARLQQLQLLPLMSMN